MSIACPWVFLGRALRMVWHGFALCVCLVQQPAVAQQGGGTAAFSLDLPVSCTLGQDCHVLAYVDQMPGPKFQDFGGGRQTYDEHDGTDFGIADEAVMKKGVAVRAAAAGVVVGVRDGVTDQRIENEHQANRVRPKGCGNAVIIDHQRDWRTYYCHLRNGSVAVKTGMRVEKGFVLGMVGSSGLASYPHLHFGVFHQGRKIDPFAPPSLWEKPLGYVSAGLINAGFNNENVSISAVWQGALPSVPLTTQTPSIVFWAHPFGVMAGDVEHLRLISPEGKTVVQRRVEIKSPNRINRVSLIGKRNTPAQPIVAGIWQGEYQLSRNERLLIDVKRVIEVKPHDRDARLAAPS